MCPATTLFFGQPVHVCCMTSCRYIVFAVFAVLNVVTGTCLQLLGAVAEERDSGFGSPSSYLMLQFSCNVHVIRSKFCVASCRLMLRSEQVCFNPSLLVGFGCDAGSRLRDACFWKLKVVISLYLMCTLASSAIEMPR